MEEANLTRHSVQRIRERLGLSKKAAEREMERVIRDGMRIDDLSGSYRRYIDYMRHRHNETSDYITTPSGIFVFTNGALVTVLPVPKEHSSKVLHMWKKRKEAA